MSRPAMEALPDYCRQIESYLCQKNGGHLVRIVGPAFETVRGWAEQGVPLKIAFRGIDRCVERAAARAGRRRPLRIEFCEADVLQLFDDWRRAIGAGASTVSETPGESEEWGTSRKGSLNSHITRSVSRLLVVKAAKGNPAFDAVIARVTGELDELAATARAARGDQRAAMVARLAALDAELLDAARGAVSEATRASLLREADGELAGLASRMPSDQLARARALAYDRLLRDTLNLPVLSYE